MMFTMSWWAVAVVLSLAACGFLAVCWVVSGWAEQAADWWRRDRVIPLLEDCEHEYTPNEDGTYEWCQKCDSVRPTLLELPPERTWEQMTSHQLPLAWVGEDISWWTPQRERRAPWWEAEHRAAYESLGFDYPSGLMERVRELTP